MSSGFPLQNQSRITNRPTWFRFAAMFQSGSLVWKESRLLLNFVFMCIGSIRKFYKRQSTFFAYSKHREQIKTRESEDSGADQRFYRWDVIGQALVRCSYLLSALVSRYPVPKNQLRLASETSGLNVGQALNVARADCSVTRCSWTGQRNRLDCIVFTDAGLRINVGSYLQGGVLNKPWSIY